MCGGRGGGRKIEGEKQRGRTDRRRNRLSADRQTDSQKQQNIFLVCGKNKKKKCPSVSVLISNKFNSITDEKRDK